MRRTIKSETFEGKETDALESLSLTLYDDEVPINLTQNGGAEVRVANTQDVAAFEILPNTIVDNAVVVYPAKVLPYGTYLLEVHLGTGDTKQVYPSSGYVKVVVHRAVNGDKGTLHVANIDDLYTYIDGKLTQLQDGKITTAVNAEAKLRSTEDSRIDGSAVHKTGDETISGVKNFSSLPSFNTEPLPGMIGPITADTDWNSLTGTGWTVVGTLAGPGSPLKTFSNAYGYGLLLLFKSGSMYTQVYIPDSHQGNAKILYRQTWKFPFGSVNDDKWRAIGTDDALVHNLGDETITGTKNFTGTLQVGGKRVFPGNQGIPSGADLNDYQDFGFYRAGTDAVATTLKNSPTTQAFSMSVTNAAGANQFLCEYPTGVAHIWRRSYYNTTWGDWHEILQADQSITISGIYTYTNDIHTKDGSPATSQTFVKNNYVSLYAASIDLNPKGNTQTSYIDFHTQAGTSANDYDARILATGGAPGANGKGVINITADSVLINGKPLATQTWVNDLIDAKLKEKGL